MTTADPVSGITAPPAHPGAGLLVLLAAMTPDNLEHALANLTAAFPTESLLIAMQGALPAGSYPSLRIVAAPATNPSWTLTAADFVNVYQLAEKNGSSAILMLGPAAGSLDSVALRDLASAVLTTPTDLAVPFYNLPARAGLVNSAILYPLTRALFASPVRFPLAVHLGLSLRMAQSLADAAHRFTASNQAEMPLWPINEATVAGLVIDQFYVSPLVQSQHTGLDLNTILPLVTGALFSDIDAKAAFWQRFRPLSPARNAIPAPIPVPQAPPSDAAAEIAPMIYAFRLAYTNIEEVWSLVLPPSSLFALKRLSATDGPAFRISDSLWARIVYDFVLAYRLRTINRGHLLGALIPLYLAWVASHINITASGTDPESHIEAVAAAFEADKTYLVSRWRWPDRFNP
jgi:hypothetical protein